MPKKSGFEGRRQRPDAKELFYDGCKFPCLLVCSGDGFGHRRFAISGAENLFPHLFGLRPTARFFLTAIGLTPKNAQSAAPVYRLPDKWGNCRFAATRGRTTDSAARTFDRQTRTLDTAVWKKCREIFRVRRRRAARFAELLTGSSENDCFVLKFRS